MASGKTNQITGLNFKAEIPVNGDCNNYNTAGVYYIGHITNRNIQNAPTGFSYSMMLVMASPNMIVQFVFKGAAMATRECSGAPAAWGAWKQYS